jgi:hypothetical protein
MILTSSCALAPSRQTLRYSLKARESQRPMFKFATKSCPDGNSLQREKALGDDPILTIEDGKAYAGKKNWGEDPILSFEDDKIYSGRKHIVPSWQIGPGW